MPQRHIKTKHLLSGNTNMDPWSNPHAYTYGITSPPELSCERKVSNTMPCKRRMITTSTGIKEVKKSHRGGYHHHDLARHTLLGARAHTHQHLALCSCAGHARALLLSPTFASIRNTSSTVICSRAGQQQQYQQQQKVQQATHGR